MKIVKVTHKDYYWECGEPGCCSDYGTDSIFEHEGEIYEIRGPDGDTNLLEFINTVLKIEFEQEWDTDEDD